MKMKSNPKISIVTIVYNDVYGIRETVNSVLEQSYHNVEYIVVDGGSSDGTVDIIKDYSDRIFCFISEPDKGIYDAMNKGVKTATGEWIIFMNSGDCFFEKNTLEKIFSDQLDSVRDVDAIYSDMVCMETSKVSKARGLMKIWIGNPCSHQSLFVKTEIMKERLFDLKYKISADYDFIYYLYYQKYKFFYLKDVIISKCVGSVGLSKQYSPFVILRDSFFITQKYARFYQVIGKLFVCILAYIAIKLKKIMSNINQD